MIEFYFQSYKYVNFTVPRGIIFLRWDIGMYVVCNGIASFIFQEKKKFLSPVVSALT
jgi:hypothetical protein